MLADTLGYSFKVSQTILLNIYTEYISYQDNLYGFLHPGLIQVLSLSLGHTYCKNTTIIPKQYWCTITKYL